METSEHTVLSRILYPDRSAALLYGKAHHSLDDGSSLKQIKRQRETDLTLGKLFQVRIAVKYDNTLLLAFLFAGIASMQRKNSVSLNEVPEKGMYEGCVNFLPTYIKKRIVSYFKKVT